jgi:predicted DNA-binding transcriptional regulator AlpA
MPNRLLTMNEGFARMRMSRSEYYRRRKLKPGDANYDPLFPKIVKPLGSDSKASALLEAEIDLYIAERIAERDAGKITYTTPELLRESCHKRPASVIT